jgi:anti-anti-sigma factor
LTVLRLSLDVVIYNGNGRQAEASALEIAVERNGDTGSMSLVGELDHSQTERFAEQLRGLTQESAVRNLTLDLQDLRSIDPAGLGVIRAAWEAADQSGVDAILVRASSDLRFALEESGLDRVLPVIYECPDRPPGL